MFLLLFYRKTHVFFFCFLIYIYFCNIKDKQYYSDFFIYSYCHFLWRRNASKEFSPLKKFLLWLAYRRWLFSSSVIVHTLSCRGKEILSYVRICCQFRQLDRRIGPHRGLCVIWCSVTFQGWGWLDLPHSRSTQEWGFKISLWPWENHLTSPGYILRLKDLQIPFQF